eukprot:TRINITY_DN975_c1_g1_i1.p1 TRINITY_DN975_c1_g1~~TRINITY_DN975_c1_g1_i1.p1  ORF type:complete len:277 (+),score=96.94 TRINITY_DN975_c1_g1_i1:109-939(+)
MVIDTSLVSRVSGSSSSSMASSKSTETATSINHASLVGPYRLRGKVVTGFQRGSKQLGFPTANLDPDTFQLTLKGVPHGVYVGWAQVNDGPVYKAFVSIGKNPQFNNTNITVEAYLLHEFSSNFYGEVLSLIICGYLRPQKVFRGLDELKTAISKDVETGSHDLDHVPSLSALSSDPFFYAQSQSKKYLSPSLSTSSISSLSSSLSTPSSSSLSSSSSSSSSSSLASSSSSLSVRSPSPSPSPSPSISLSSTPTSSQSSVFPHSDSPNNLHEAVKA